MKRLVSILVSAAILAVIYWQIDAGALLEALAGSELSWLAVGVLLVVPITVVTALRFILLLPADTRIGYGEAVRLTLAASSLNLVLPSKMGDVAKAWFIRNRGYLDGSQALVVVVFDKLLDMLSLLAWCVLGLVLFPGKDALFWALTAAIAGGLLFGVLMIGSPAFAETVFGLIRRVAPRRLAARIAPLADYWDELLRRLSASPGRYLLVVAVSLGLWFLHLLQIWVFVLALRAFAPLLDSFAMAALAILAGLLPLTFAGIGTRDAALILFFAPWMAAPVAAALGILCTLRYLLPGLGGLPYLGTYLGLARERGAAP